MCTIRIAPGYMPTLWGKWGLLSAKGLFGLIRRYYTYRIIDGHQQLRLKGTGFMEALLLV